MFAESRYDRSMLIPYGKLTAPTLRAVVEEFVTRDGTDHSLVEMRVETVLRQLKLGQVELHFDTGSATTNFVTVVKSTDCHG